MNTRNRTLLALLTAALAATLVGCSSTDSEVSNVPADASSVVTIEDAWVKSADSGMTAGFGILRNSGTDDVTVTSVSTDVAASAELHETVVDDAGAMVMRQIEGGFTLPAGESFPLEPAANHLMMMDLTGALVAGDEVPFVLEFDDGSSLEFTAVVKDYSGANEEYVGDDMGDMDMGGDE